MLGRSWGMRVGVGMGCCKFGSFILLFSRKTFLSLSWQVSLISVYSCALVLLVWWLYSMYSVP